MTEAVIAVVLWIGAGVACWRTFVVEPREMREMFARNRAAAKLCATPHDPNDLWPGVLEWFGLNYADD